MTAFSVPFHVNVFGRVATTRSYEEEVQQRVEALLRTTLRERVMRPGYGVNLQSVLFEPSESVARLVLETTVTDALQAYEPDVRVDTFEVIVDPENRSVVYVKLQYYIFESEDGSDNLREAVVTLTGDVDEGI